MTENGSSFELSSPRPSDSQGVAIKKLTGVEASPSRGLFGACLAPVWRPEKGQYQEAESAVISHQENYVDVEVRLRRAVKYAPTESPLRLPLDISARAQSKATQLPCSTVLAFQFSHMELEQTGAAPHTPLSPAPSSLRTPASATSKSAYTPASAGSNHGALSSLTPPRTPEERVLHLLADEPDDADEEPCFHGRRNGTHIGATSCYDGNGRTCNEQDDSSGDELSPEDLERLGISPLSLQASSCRTPVDDVIDLMLHEEAVENDLPDERGCAVSPVSYKERFSAEQ